jgi:hypothetical protein
LANVAHFAKAEIVTLYWSVLFFNTLEYQPGYENLSSDSLSSLTVPQALQNMANSILTPIGAFYQTIIQEACGCPVLEEPLEWMSAPKLELAENYPNPFNLETTISYTITKKLSGIINLSVFNSQGQRVITLVHEHQQPGTYNIGFYADELSSGLYIYRLRTDDCQITKKMLILK